MLVGIWGINTYRLAGCAAHWSEFRSACYITDWSYYSTLLVLSAVYLQTIGATACSCQNGECCLLFPWFLECIVRGDEQRMWKEEEKVSHARVLSDHTGKRDSVCFYFLFLVLPKYMWCRLCWRRVFASHYTLCAATWVFWYLALLPCVCVHRSQRQCIWLVYSFFFFFPPATFPSSPYELLHL